MVIDRKLELKKPKRELGLNELELKAKRKFRGISFGDTVKFFEKKQEYFNSEIKRLTEALFLDPSNFNYNKDLLMVFQKIKASYEKRLTELNYYANRHIVTRWETRSWIIPLLELETKLIADLNKKYNKN